LALHLADAGRRITPARIYSRKVAFATILAVVSGLTLAVASAASKALLCPGVIRRGLRGEQRTWLV